MLAFIPQEAVICSYNKCLHNVFRTNTCFSTANFIHFWFSGLGNLTKSGYNLSNKEFSCKYRIITEKCSSSVTMPLLHAFISDIPLKIGYKNPFFY